MLEETFAKEKALLLQCALVEAWKKLPHVYFEALDVFEGEMGNMLPEGAHALSDAVGIDFDPKDPEAEEFDWASESVATWARDVSEAVSAKIDHMVQALENMGPEQTGEKERNRLYFHRDKTPEVFRYNDGRSITYRVRLWLVGFNPFAERHRLKREAFCKKLQAKTNEFWEEKMAKGYFDLEGVLLVSAEQKVVRMAVLNPYDDPTKPLPKQENPVKYAEFEVPFEMKKRSILYHRDDQREDEKVVHMFIAAAAQALKDFIAQTKPPRDEDEEPGRTRMVLSFWDGPRVSPPVWHYQKTIRKDEAEQYRLVHVYGGTSIEGNLQHD